MFEALNGFAGEMDCVDEFAGLGVGEEGGNCEADFGGGCAG